MASASGAFIAIGLIIALIGAVLFILGISPAVQYPSQPANISEVGLGAILMVVGFAFAIMGGMAG